MGHAYSFQSNFSKVTFLAKNIIVDHLINYTRQTMTNFFQGIKCVYTGKRTAHLPKRHCQFLVQTKNFPRGFSRALSDGPLTVTYWCDKNAVVFFDNDVSSARHYWSTHKVSGKSLWSLFYMTFFWSKYSNVLEHTRTTIKFTDSLRIKN